MSTEQPAEVPGGEVSGSEVPGRESVPLRRRRVLLFGLVAAFALALDIISKALIVALLGDGPPVRILGGAVYLDQTRNSGAAFSLGTGATVVFTVIALIVVVVILRAARRMRSVGWAVALGLILGGALGNLVDRLFRAPGVGRGHVVDWISLFGPYGVHYPIFNLADSAVVIGAIVAVLVALRGIDLDGTTRAERDAAREQADLPGGR